jgi:alpha-ketoglutarate-dependent taurine dioxygenase
MKGIGEKRNPKARPNVRRRSVSASQADWIDVRPYSEKLSALTLVTPKLEELDLNEWAANNQELIQSMWEEKRVILFRDFHLGGPEGLEAFIGQTADSEPLPYMDRSTPRKSYGKHIYCTTIYPPEYTIRLHNEGSYWTVHALKAYFACITAPETGGETPVADVHAVYNRIDPEVREEFARKKWCLVRNFNDGFALPWQEVYQTTDRKEVEEYCRENDVQYEWKGGNRLRTRQVRHAILDHPRTGEKLWHNHVAFFNVVTRESLIREALTGEFGEDDLPYNTYYGDGTPIDPDVIRHINEAYDAETIMFPWQENDVVLVDNMRLAHARQPFTGDRLILVALTEPWVPPPVGKIG